MFMFMEGLPRSGKSYETCVYYIIECLKKGRPVDAYVEGLNHQQFSDLSGVPLDEVKELLVQITREQVPEIYKYARKDALVVIDELQNFWPAGRQKLPPIMIKFVTEHGHEGQDIIGMGQVLSDCHTLFKNRCQRKFVFQKQDQVGRVTKYTWTSYNGKINDQGKVVFKKANSGTREYNEKYFGLYKSHSEGTSNFDTFEDSRTNIFNNKTFRFVLPAFAAAVIGAIYFLVTFVFSGTGLVDTEKENATYQIETSTDFSSLESSFNAAPVIDQAPTAVSLSPDPEVLKYSEPEDYVDNVAQQYKLRLAGVATNPKNGTTIVIIQAFDNSLHLKERFTSQELTSLGWDIELTGYGVRLHRNERQYIVRPWPIDPFGKVNQTTISQL